MSAYRGAWANANSKATCELFHPSPVVAVAERVIENYIVGRRRTSVNWRPVRARGTSLFGFVVVDDLHARRLLRA
ncbi:MAG: hypothetical protein WA317_18940 [Mycobacterium sp.]|uniref:hypothetical protein n=1 Tax=Mycobacterium sp. TaxID=1785 RepID=UPI003CC59F89